MVMDAQELEQAANRGAATAKDFDFYGIKPTARLEVPIREIDKYPRLAELLEQLAKELRICAKSRHETDIALALRIMANVQGVQKLMRQEMQSDRPRTKSRAPGSF